MTNEQIEQYREIVKGAEPKATHTADNASLRETNKGYMYWCPEYEIWDYCNLSDFNNVQSLDNLRTIIAQHDEIKELEQQLAAKPDLQGVDWSIIEPEYNWLAQNKGSGTIDFHRVKPTDSNYAILETRPKSKYTPEQIEAVKDFEAWVSRRHNLSGEFNWWLKEVGND